MLMNTHYWKRTMLLYTVLFLDYFVFSETKVKLASESYLTFQSHRYSLKFPPSPLLCRKDAQYALGFGSVWLLKEAGSTSLCFKLHYTFLLLGLMFVSYKKRKSFVLTDC